MSYDEIMKNITDGLTGDWKKDKEYLDEQSKFYRTHDLATEILRGIGRLTSDILPPENLKEINRLFENVILGENAVIEEAEFQHMKKNYDKALMIIESFIKVIEPRENGYKLFQDDSVSEYHNFRNILEEAIYRKLNNPEKTIRNMRRDFDRAYLVYGTLLFELKRYYEAEEALKKAIGINPINLEAWFELSEIIKIRQAWEKYLEVSKHCLKIAYTSKDVGRCYRNLGFYYVKMQSFDLAATLYDTGRIFDPEILGVGSELFNIQQVTGKPAPILAYEEVKKMYAENDIQYGPNITVLRLALEIGQQAVKEEHYGIAHFLYSVVYDLTGDKDAKDMIDRLPSKENNAD